MAQKLSWHDFEFLQLSWTALKCLPLHLGEELYIAPQTGGIVKCHTIIVNYDMGGTQELEEIFCDQQLCNRRTKYMGNKTEL